MSDRISEIRLAGLRCLRDVKLALHSGLTVLIGENGTGKSTFIEGIELLRKAPRREFISEFHRIHGGFAELGRTDGSNIMLSVSFDDGKSPAPVVYSCEIGRRPGGAYIASEKLMVAGDVLDERTDRQGRMVDERGDLVASSFAHDKTVAAQLDATEPPPTDSLAGRLGALAVHLPFEVRAAWSLREMQRESPMRGSTLFEPAEGLSRYGANLVNVLHALKNGDRPAWEETLQLVRMGLGQSVEDINIHADPGGGRAALSVRIAGQDVRAFTLSDGQLAYLAFVALTRVPKAPSLLALDEPEHHLHPALLGRVVAMLEDLGERCPVIITTHSDRLLDMLSEPEKSVVLCVADGEQGTQLVRPDPEALARWRDKYRGIGQLRAEGLQSAVFKRP
ncbi:MAG: AAA family ATPase [Deltaproteobacteria bacterium]|nr:AAA family ATPase [Deltaproteobacteria bacterium]